jgi:hypothetical protein
MATKNIVPRGNNEGKLGTDEKRWNSVIAETASFTTFSGSITGNEFTLFSGSAQSTASFGYLLGDGRGLTNLTATTTPAGNDTYVQFNDGGLTGGDAGFTYDKTTNSITSITNITASGNISSSGFIYGDGSLLTNLPASFTSTGISGSFTSTSSSLASRLSTEESNVDTLQSTLATEQGYIDTLQSTMTSEQTNIDNLQTDSGSFSTRVTTLEALDTDDDLNFAGDSGTGTIDLDSETLTIAGGGGMSSVASGNSVTLNLDSGILSSSAQIASDISGSLGPNASVIRGLTNVSISGSFTQPSSSFSTRLTTEEANIDTLESKVGQSLNTSDSPTFAGLTTTGDITARNYIVSSSVTYMTSSFSSGSTIFGDDITDTHQFTGSVYVSGSLTAVNLTADSSSFSSRITTAELELGNTLISSSAQIATQISGSLGSNASLIRGLTAPIISGSWQGQNFISASQVTPNLPANTLSSSAQIASNISGSLGANATLIRGLTNARISGSFTAVSSSLASRIETREAFTTQSFSDGTATLISGSVVSTGSFGRIETAGASDIGGALIVGGVLSIPNINDVSASLAAAVAGGDNLGNHTATTTLNLSSNAITNVTTLTATGNISSSITSTGSFGHIIKGGVNWDTAVSASAATAGFGSGGGGGSSFTAAGISGSFTDASSSLASRITTREAFTTQSFSDGTATIISGSSTSTGSFGHLETGGDILPLVDNSKDLGSASKRWANIYSADLQLSNEGAEGNEVDGTTGSWTIQEGDGDLYLLNRKNGKKYRFKIEEIK